MGRVRILRPGLQTTVQDLGRWGMQAYGVPVAGAMDLWSHRLANALVGNRPDAATLEATLVGPTLELDEDRIVAATGAEFVLTLSGAAAPMNTPFLAPAGARLQFGARRHGARVYLAIEGGVDVPVVFGSRATHLVTGMGGFQGRALAAGDCLPLGARRSGAHVGGDGTDVASVIRSVPLEPEGHVRARVLPGPQLDRFERDALAALQSAPYLVAPESDRMGFRLSGPALRHARTADMISDASPLGALQVPASGQPILLTADRPTTGGYPKIATVISADLGAVAQLAPGERVSFSVCSPREALSALIARERPLLALEAQARS